MGAPQQSGGYAPGGGLPPLANVALSGAVWLSKYQPGAVPAFSLYGYVQGTEATTDAPGATGKAFGRAVSLSKDANILSVGIPGASVTLAGIACHGIVRAFSGISGPMPATGFTTTSTSAGPQDTIFHSLELVR